MSLNILGEQYEVIEESSSSEPELLEFDGLCDSIEKKIIVSSDIYKREENKEKADDMLELTLRHEIVHAFLAESGLQDESWAVCEEIVDWIAIQGPKIFRAWAEVNAV